MLYRYFYNILQFITCYDSTSNLLAFEAKNISKISYFSFTVNANNRFTKMVRLNSQASIAYLNSYNSNIDYRNNGWSFFLTANTTYKSQKDLGFIFTYG